MTVSGTEVTQGRPDWGNLASGVFEPWVSRLNTSTGNNTNLGTFASAAFKGVYYRLAAGADKWLITITQYEDDALTRTIRTDNRIAAPGDNRRGWIPLVGNFFTADLTKSPAAGSENISCQLIPVTYAYDRDDVPHSRIFLSSNGGVFVAGNTTLTATEAYSGPACAHFLTDASAWTARLELLTFAGSTLSLARFSNTDPAHSNRPFLFYQPEGQIRWFMSNNDGVARSYWFSALPLHTFPAG